MSKSVRPKGYASAMAQATVVGIEAAPSPQQALDAYRYAADSIRNCLQLGDQVAGYGNAAGAADYLVGALEDLSPQLALLAAFRDSRR